MTKKRQRKRKAELDPEEEEEESDGEIEEDMIEESEDDDIDLLEVPEWDVDSFDGLVYSSSMERYLNVISVLYVFYIKPKRTSCHIRKLDYYGLVYYDL